MHRDWKSLPKIELHCHLDGSLSLEVTRRLLAERGESWSLEDLREALQAPMDCPDLSDYLRRFDLPNQVLQRESELEDAALDLAEHAAEENVRYLECRFAPVFSTAEGLKVQQVLEAVWKGFQRAREKTGIETGIIVCGMRGLSEEANLSMLKAAAEMKDCGVVACDLAGDEKAYPMREFVYFFRKAKEYGLPFTIHAGEQGSCENICGAIELGASRIGHGIAMMADRGLQKLCADKRIGVELCPTSNLQTKAVSNFVWYPLKRFYQEGIPVSINTDNRTVSGTSMTEEYVRVFGQFPLEADEARQGEESFPFGSGRTQKTNSPLEAVRSVHAAEASGILPDVRRPWDESVLEQIYRDSVEVSFASDEVKDRLLSV